MRWLAGVHNVVAIGRACAMSLLLQSPAVGLFWSEKKNDQGKAYRGTSLQQEMSAMVREQKVEHGFEERINDYLSGFKSENQGRPGDDPVDDDTLDEYLLQRAAQQLRAASDRLRKLEQAIKEG